jgi:membrane protein implicated in regulation of membrane protease activity
MIDLVSMLGPWTWIVLGLLLIGLELVAPGVFFLWLGLAAVLTGLLDWAFRLSWQTSALVFAILSIAAVILGRMLTRQGDDEPEANSSLNRRGHALVGRTFTLDAPIIEGSGRVRVDDSSWRVIGPDMPAGSSVRVVRVEGATLVVERA